MEKSADNRRSRRYAARLDVELAQGSTTQRCYSVDVSRHGIFLATERPPRERFLVRVVLELPDGPLYANAFVSRSVTPGHGIQPGVGLQFFAMPDLTRNRWDKYVTWLSGMALPVDAEAAASSFLVKLPDRQKLREFFEKISRTTNLYMVTPVVRPVGSPVAVVLVHPESKQDFVVSGRIARVRLEAPKGVEIRLNPLTSADQEAFSAFLDGRQPDEAWPAAPSGPVSAPPDPDADPLMAFPGSQGAGLESTLPRPSFPAEPTVRSGDVAPISADLPKAISVDVGGPEAVPENVPAEQRFDWSVVSDDLVIDVDLSEIEGEDLAELRGEINVRITKPPAKNGSTSAPPPRDELPPAIPRESAPPKPDRVTADLRHLPRARPLSRPDDGPLPPVRPSDPLHSSSGDVFREHTPPPQPRRLRTIDLDEAVVAQAVSPPVLAEAPAAPPPVPEPPPPTVEASAAPAPAPPPTTTIEASAPPSQPVEVLAPPPPAEEPAPIALAIPPPATTQPDLLPAGARGHAETDADDETEAEADEVSPRTSVAPTIDEHGYPELDPVRHLHLECAHCGHSSPLKAGHPPPPLGLFASHRTYACKKCKSFVSVLRLASSRTRGMVRKALEATGDLEGPAPLSMSFEIADLAQPARCPSCTSMLRVTKQTDAVEAALETAGTEPQRLPKVSCPRCHEFGMGLRP